MGNMVTAALAKECFTGYIVRMTRRRLILAACVAVVALGAAWWGFDDRLTVEEQHLVGAWQTPTFDNGGKVRTFRPDRSFRLRLFWPGGGKVVDGTRWYVRDGSRVTDFETNPFRRFVRAAGPATSVLGIKADPALPLRILSVSATQIEVGHPNGVNEIWTRVPAD
jgi:hypothetical protein